MNRPIHPNAIISSNLLRISAFLTLPGYYFFTAHDSVRVIWGVIFSIILLIGSAYLVRNGYNWVRWVLAVISLFGILFLPFAIPAIFNKGLIDGVFSLLQTTIQTIAAILLFVPYKIPNYVGEDEFETKE